MPPSYEGVNFLLRPAKHVERKMICDCLRRLVVFAPLEGYGYVGFGANSFGDFSLFHRVLGITSMVSIESEEEDKDRFELNKPYGAITMAYGLSGAVLGNSLNPARPTILWLDYDKQLDASKLGDLRLFVSSGLSGSVLLITVCAESERRDDRLGELKSRVGSEAVPPDLQEVDLEGWGYGRAERRIINSAVQEVLVDRNGALPENERFSYKQFASFEYKDGMRMITLGGLLYRESDSDLVERSGLAETEWHRPGNDSYRIASPHLTIREMRFLDSQLPCSLETVKRSGIPLSDVRDYASLYRFYPRWVDADV